MVMSYESNGSLTSATPPLQMSPCPIADEPLSSTIVSRSTMHPDVGSAVSLPSTSSLNSIWLVTKARSVLTNYSVASTRMLIYFTDVRKCFILNNGNSAILPSEVVDDYLSTKVSLGRKAVKY